jgi:hypothetical protein
MFMRTFAIVVLSVVLQSMAYAQTTSPPLDSFASDGLGLLPSSESTALTSQANMGVHSATKIQPFLAPQALRNYKTIFNSSAILANFPMSESAQQKLNLSIDESLGKSRRVSVASLTDAQSALYSAISVKKNGDGSAILEVLVGVSDWTKVKERKAEGPVPALVKSSVWVSISRQKLAWEAVSTDGTLSFEKIEKAVISSYRDNINQILLAF